MLGFGKFIFAAAIQSNQLTNQNLTKGYNDMKKLIALLLGLVCALSLAACSASDAKPQAEATNLPTAIDSDAALKAELLAKYGNTFKFYLAFDMELITFHFDETTVIRKHHDSMKDDVPTHHAAWDIADGELVVTGEWNEAFLLDLENKTAISKTDGREYPVYEVE